MYESVSFSIYGRTGVWARVWDHWNHSFNMYLSYLGVSMLCFLIPSLLWVHHWDSFSCRLLDGGHPWWCFYSEFPQGASMGMAAMAWYLQHHLLTDMTSNIFLSQFFSSEKCKTTITSPWLRVCVCVCVCVTCAHIHTSASLMFAIVLPSVN